MTKVSYPAAIMGRMEPMSARFTTTVRALSLAARSRGLEAPGFRSPPRVAGADRTLRRSPDGTVVAVRLRGRQPADVLADMVEGIVVANRLTGEQAAGARRSLLEAAPVASGDVQVRPANPGELAALAGLTVAAYRALPGGVGGEYEADLRDTVGRSSTDGLELLVAVDDGRLLGGVTYVSGGGPYREFPDAGEDGFRHLAVDPATQRRGVGAALVGACAARARATGKQRLALFTTAKMTAAHRLYEKVGFRRVPERDWALSEEISLLSYVLDLA